MGVFILKTDWKTVFKIAFTYIGTVVGAGFASGQEIVQFFTSKGPFSFIAIALASGGFAWLGNRMMLIGARLEASSYEAFNDYLFGKRFGRIMNGFVTIILFGVTTAMISGTGAMAEEQVGVSFHFGVLFTLLLAYITIVRGLDGILAVNSLVVPMMVVFCAVLGISSFLTWSETTALPATPSAAVPPLAWLVSAVTYLSYNLAMAQCVLVPMGSEIADERTIKKGGLIGGIGLGLMLLTTNFALSLENSAVTQLEIPLAPIIAELGTFVKVLFLAVMWAEIFTTLIGNVYGLAANLETVFVLGHNKMLLLLFALGYACSLIGFSNMVGYAYPLFGYTGIATMVLLAFSRLPQHKSH